MSKKMLAVVIMRAQGVTPAHIELIMEGFKVANDVLVLVGSTNRSPDTRNPWNFFERVDMLRQCIPASHSYMVEFKGMKDYLYADDEWEGAAELTVNTHLHRLAGNDQWPGSGQVVLVGHRKDKATGEYLDMFPRWEKHYIEPVGNYNATDLRKAFFSGESVEGLGCPQAIKWMNKWKEAKPDRFLNIQERYRHIERSKAPYKDLPYGIKFMTGDPLVICNGHVLLAKRAKGTYGEGQWAIPGGYVDQYESVRDAIFRELYEETSIDIPPRALRMAFRGYRKFEHPGRDERGDFTTFCGVFSIERNPNGTLPKVTPQTEEVSEVRWVPFADLKRYERKLFLDHGFIIEVMRRAVSINDNSI